MRRIFTSLLVIFSFLSVAIAQQTQWTFDKLLYDFNLPQSNGYGVHGVAVDPNGNIWMALHGNLAQDTMFTANGDTINLRPIYVVDPTGKQLPFSPIEIIDMGNGVLDTLSTKSDHNGSGKGISIAQNGNILYTSYSTVYEINYQTGQGVHRFIPTTISSLTEAVQDKNGLIYVGYVLKNKGPIYILDKDFNLIGSAVDTLRYINRTLAVSANGKDLFTGSVWNGFGVVQYHSDLPGVVSYAAVDTFGNWDSVYVADKDTTYKNVKMWASCLDWGPDSNLWVGDLRDDWSSGGAETGSHWYVFDPVTKAMKYSVGKGYPADPSTGGLYSPRGAAWSADGQTMYLADYDYNVVGIWKKTAVSIERDGQVVARIFSLGQNYPNPFNPTTTIPFELNKAAHVTLNVFDIQGRLVKNLINNDMSIGKHRLTFNAGNLASGMYYYQLNIDGQQLTKQMMLVK